jgi:heme/copper-type cytochrome/quinol oxidase subunit 3
MDKPNMAVKIEESTAKRGDIAPVISKDKLGVWFFLGGEVTLFGTLIMTYLIFRITYPADYAGFRSHLNIPLIAVNTLVLVLSSYFVVRTVEAAKNDHPRGVFLNLIIVMVLGALFISGQAYEWSTLLGEGVKLDNTFGSPFYVITGIHGAHVLIGLAWASIALFFGFEKAYNSNRYRGIEIFGLYWHFVDIVWIVLFSLIYLI